MVIFLYLDDVSKDGGNFLKKFLKLFSCLPVIGMVSPWQSFDTTSRNKLQC